MTKPRSQPKQKQHRMRTRAPHGSPDYPERVAAWVTTRQRRAFDRNGGSIWLRGVIDFALSCGLGRRTR